MATMPAVLRPSARLLLALALSRPRPQPAYTFPRRSHFSRMAQPRAPPAGIYVPATLFFTENEDLDIPAIEAHVLRLAKVRTQSHLSSPHRSTHASHRP